MTTQKDFHKCRRMASKKRGWRGLLQLQDKLMTLLLSYHDKELEIQERYYEELSKRLGQPLPSECKPELESIEDYLQKYGSSSGDAPKGSGSNKSQYNHFVSMPNQYSRSKLSLSERLTRFLRQLLIIGWLILGCMYYSLKHKVSIPFQKPLFIQF